MKKRIVLVGRSVVCVLLVGCTALSVYQLRKTQTSGWYSDVCGIISPKAQKWILSEFGDCSTLEDLLQHLDNFGIEHFVYDGDKKYFMGLQTFDLDGFLFGESRYRGLCFDFSCWVKDCVLVWADAHEEQVEVFVIDVITKAGSAHSYNIIRYNGKMFILDVTVDNSRARKGKAPIGVVCWGDVSLNEVAEQYGDKVMIWR
ncbi:MAG: hypothetical protein IKZ47_04405 [Clostridia bacterium]|nr:hypothetical protein [Clostridia bacterium]